MTGESNFPAFLSVLDSIDNTLKRIEQIQADRLQMAADVNLAIKNAIGKAFELLKSSGGQYI